MLLGDRGFCSYLNLAALGQRGVDGVMRLHQARPIDFRLGKRLGFDDRLVIWSRPAQRLEGPSEAEWLALPQTLKVRLIRLRVSASGFRTRTGVLATTLLDPVGYPADTLRALYGRRWQMEGHFFQLKETLALDVRRCQSPHMTLARGGPPPDRLSPWYGP